MDADLVLGLAADLALASGTRMVEPAAIQDAASTRNLDGKQLFAALADLRDRGLVQLATAEPPQIGLLALTNAGLQQHLRATRRDLADVEARLAGAAAAAVGEGAVLLAEQLGEPALLVECLLDTMVSDRRLTYSKAPGRRFRIHRVLRG